MRCAVVWAVTLSMLAVGRAYARTWNITPDGTGDAPTIQAGIDSAVAGDDVLLAPGYYAWIDQGARLPAMLVMKAGVRLHGEDGPDVTVIDAQDQACGIQCSWIGSESSIEGLTVKRGWDAGIYVRSCSPTISGNVVTETNGAAGILCEDQATPFIFENIVTANRGDGISCVDGSSPTVTKNTVTENGGGIHCSGVSEPMIRENFIAFNTGRGVACYNSANATIEHNIIRDNAVNGSGGGMHFNSCSPVVSHNLILSNTAVRGAGISCYRCSAMITNNTLVGNSAGTGAGIYLTDEASPTIWRNIVTGSIGGYALHCDSDSSPMGVVCNDWWNNEAGEGNCYIHNGDNIRLDPMFCDEELGNYYLHTDSPCAPENAPPACGLIGALPTDCSPAVAVECLTWGRVKAMYR